MAHYRGINQGVIVVLTPKNELFFSHIMTGTSFNSMQDDDVHIVLDQHAYLDLYSASSLKQQSADRHVAPLGHIILIPSHPVLLLLFKADV